MKRFLGQITALDIGILAGVKWKYMAVRLETGTITPRDYIRPSSSPAIRHLSDFRPTAINTHEASDISDAADKWMASDSVTLDKLVRESSG